MSTETPAAGATPVAAPTAVQTPAVPAVVVPPAVVAPAAPAVVAAPAPGPEDNAADPQWLAKRLTRESEKAKAGLLKSLGFANEAEAVAAATAANAAKESAKTLEQKALEAGQRADTEKAGKDRALAVVTEHAARMMIGLTPEQTAAVKAVAGDDPVSQLNAIGALAPTWASAAKTAQEAAAATATANAAATAAAAATVTTNTAPAVGAPNGNNPPPQNVRAAYEQVRASNPFEAAVLGQRNPGVYEPKTQ